MEKDDLFELKLSEAKDQLIHIDISIKETRTKVFYLIGICFALLGFLCEDVVLSNFFTVKSIMFYPSILMVSMILYKCNKSITPPKQRMNGIMPKMFESLTESQLKDIDSIILDTYQKSIDTNGSILKSLSDDYKTAFEGLITLGILLPFLCLFASLLTKGFM